MHFIVCWLTAFGFQSYPGDKLFISSLPREPLFSNLGLPSRVSLSFSNPTPSVLSRQNLKPGAKSVTPSILHTSPPHSPYQNQSKSSTVLFLRTIHTSPLPWRLSLMIKQTSQVSATALRSNPCGISARLFQQQRYGAARH
jgi:hypothetical protein